MGNTVFRLPIYSSHLRIPIPLNTHKGTIMSEEQFALWGMRLGISGLVIMLGFIVWQLGKESKAGKWGMFILFFVLGLGVMGFLFKNVLVEFFLLTE